MSKLLFFFLLPALTTGSVLAQTASSGEITDAAWGLRFTPPAGWTLHPAPDGYLFVSPDRQGILAVLPHETGTLEALAEEARQGINDGAGTALQLQGVLEAFGEQGLAADYTGWIEGSPARARAVGLVSPHGRGATILAAVAPQYYSAELAALAEAVARSVVFTAQPVVSQPEGLPAQTSPEAQEWAEWFEGCRLSYFNRYDSGYGGGGYSDETTVDLCPGYFNYGTRSETVFNTTDPVSGNDPYLQSNRRGAGQWQVAMQGGQPALRLHFYDGTVKAFVLGYEDGKTYLDGRRWLRTCNPNDSVVEARPQCQ